MSKEAMKLALEALEKYCTPYQDGTHPADEAITALREALAEQPAPSQYGSPELQALIVARAMEKNAAEQPAQKCSYPYCGCNSKAWCKVERNEALDKMAENARELGLDYEPAQQEPFGYFKAEPFGWTDCAESDEGAVALYERPQQAQRKEDK